MVSGGAPGSAIDGNGQHHPHRGGKGGSQQGCRNRGTGGGGGVHRGGGFQQQQQQQHVPSSSSGPQPAAEAPAPAHSQQPQNDAVGVSEHSIPLTEFLQGNMQVCFTHTHSSPFPFLPQPRTHKHTNAHTLQSKDRAMYVSALSQLFRNYAKLVTKCKVYVTSGCATVKGPVTRREAVKKLSKLCRCRTYTVSERQCYALMNHQNLMDFTRETGAFAICRPKEETLLVLGPQEKIDAAVRYIERDALAPRSDRRVMLISVLARQHILDNRSALLDKGHVWIDRQSEQEGFQELHIVGYRKDFDFDSAEKAIRACEQAFLKKAASSTSPSSSAHGPSPTATPAADPQPLPSPPPLAPAAAAASAAHPVPVVPAAATAQPSVAAAAPPRKAALDGAACGPALAATPASARSWESSAAAATATTTAPQPPPPLGAFGNTPSTCRDPPKLLDHIRVAFPEEPAADAASSSSSPAAAAVAAAVVGAAGTPASAPHHHHQQQQQRPQPPQIPFSASSAGINRLETFCSVVRNTRLTSNGGSGGGGDPTGRGGGKIPPPHPAARKGGRGAAAQQHEDGGHDDYDAAAAAATAAAAAAAAAAGGDEAWGHHAGPRTGAAASTASTVDFPYLTNPLKHGMALYRYAARDTTTGMHTRRPHPLPPTHTGTIRRTSGPYTATCRRRAVCSDTPPRPPPRSAPPQPPPRRPSSGTRAAGTRPTAAAATPRTPCPGQQPPTPPHPRPATPASRCSCSTSALRTTAWWATTSWRSRGSSRSLL